MQEEKVRQCKVFVVLMQGENSCWERSDAAAAPAWTWVYVAQMGSTFYSPLPLCFFLNGEKEVESTTDLQRYYVNKRSNMPQQWFGGIWTAGSQSLNEPVDFSQSHNNNFYHKLEKNWKIFTSFYISPFCIASVWFWLSLYVFSVTFRRLYRRLCLHSREWKISPQSPSPTCDLLPRTTSTTNKLYSHCSVLFVAAADITGIHALQHFIG